MHPIFILFIIIAFFLIQINYQYVLRKNDPPVSAMAPWTVSVTVPLAW